MTANVSNTSLCNRALAAIGGKAFINSAFPSDGSAAGNACNLLYTPTYEQLARCAWWSSFQTQILLTLLLAGANTPENPTATPPFPPSPWLYQYAYPGDCLKARAIIPTVPAQGTGGTPTYSVNNNAPIWFMGRGQIPFKVATVRDANGNPIKVILTNQEQAQLNYTMNNPNPAVWDSQFQAAFVSALATFLSPALTMNMPLMQMNISIAERVIAEARASDGNEGGPNSQDNTPDWIRARSGGSGGWYAGVWQGIGYDNMAWPGVV